MRWHHDHRRTTRTGSRHPGRQRRGAGQRGRHLLFVSTGPVLVEQENSFATLTTITTFKDSNAMTERAYGQDLNPSTEPEPTSEVAGDGDRRLPGVFPERRRGITEYSTGRDAWSHGDRVPGSWHAFLGPCPTCGSRTFDYGGGWACCDSRCSKSPEHLVYNNGPAPAWWDTDIRVDRDGSAWCASGAGFVNIQESPCGFGDTPAEAVAAYMASTGVKP